MSRKIDELVLNTIASGISSVLSVPTGRIWFDYPDLENVNTSGGVNNPTTLVLPQIAVVEMDTKIKQNIYYDDINIDVSPGITTEYNPIGEYHTKLCIHLYYSTRTALKEAKNVLWQYFLKNQYLDLNNDPCSGFLRLNIHNAQQEEEFKKNIKEYALYIDAYAPVYYESTGYCINKINVLLNEENTTGLITRPIYIIPTGSIYHLKPFNPAFRQIINGDSLDATFTTGNTSSGNATINTYSASGNSITEYIYYAPNVTTGAVTVTKPIATGYYLSLLGKLRPNADVNLLSNWQLINMSDDLVYTITSSTGAMTKTYNYSSSKYGHSYIEVYKYSDVGFTNLTGLTRAKVNSLSGSGAYFTDYQVLLGASGLTIVESMDPASVTTGISGLAYTVTGRTISSPAWNFQIQESISATTGLTRTKLYSSGGSASGVEFATGYYQQFGLYDLLNRCPDTTITYRYNSSNLLTGSTILSSGYSITGNITYSISGNTKTTTISVVTGGHIPLSELEDNFYRKLSYNEFADKSGTINPYVETDEIVYPIFDHTVTVKPIYNSNGTISSMTRLFN